MSEPVATAAAAVAPVDEGTALAEQRIAVATQWQLMWWRFRKHKLAIGGSLDAMWQGLNLNLLLAMRGHT